MSTVVINQPVSATSTITPSATSVTDAASGPLVTFSGLPGSPTRTITPAVANSLALDGNGRLVAGSLYGGSAFGPYGYSISDTLVPNSLTTTGLSLAVTAVAGLGPYLPGSPVLAVGVRRLISGYSGPGIQVTRISDSATLDVYFQTGNDLLDYVSLTNFIGPYRACYVTKLYDQTGNSNHCLSPAVASAATNVPQMAMSPINLIGRSRAPRGNYAGGTWFTIPANFSINRQAATFLWAGCAQSSFKDSKPWEWGTSNNIFAHMDGAHSGFDIASYPNYLNNGDVPKAVPSCFAVTFGTTYINVYRDDRVFQRQSISAGTVTGGGYLLSQNNNSSMSGEVSAFVIYQSELSAAAVAQAQAACMPEAQRGNTRSLVMDGDSITFGFNVDGNRNFAKYMVPLLNAQADIFNFGIPGQFASQIYTNYPTIQAGMFNPSYAKNIYWVLAGTNDIYNNSQTGANVWANSLAPLLQAAKTTGFKTICVTMLPRGGTTQEGYRQDLNSAIRAASTSLIDVVCDFGASGTTMGSPGANSNTTLYGDGIHPTEYGSQLLAPVAAAAINQLL